LARELLIVTALVVVVVFVTGWSFWAPDLVWTGSFHSARCLGPCCLVSDDFLEVSCGEYNPPQPTPLPVGSYGGYYVP
jgi:hypothetical protein